jgi:hypothetical protein
MLEQNISTGREHCVGCGHYRLVRCSDSEIAATLYSCEVYLPTLQDMLKVFPIGLEIFLHTFSTDSGLNTVIVLWIYRTLGKMIGLPELFCVWICLIDFLNIPTD